MRGVVLFLIILTSLNIQGQKHQATIYFTNGNALEGLVKFKGVEKLKFKKHKKDKFKTYFWNEISKITVYEPGNGKFHFFNLKIKNKDTFVVLQQIYEGKVNLYKNISKGYVVTQSSYPSSVVPNTRNKEFVTFYVNRKGENEVFQLSAPQDSNEDFKQVAIDYFKDCDKVLKKISEKTYTKEHIQDIVFEYIISAIKKLNTFSKNNLSICNSLFRNMYFLLKFHVE